MRARDRVAVATSLLVSLAGCTKAPSETYGFVATLGNDTTSVERVTRTSRHIVSDAVERSPRVTRRHWEADLAPDGTVERWSLDTYVPNLPAPDQRIHHTADFSGRDVVLSRTDTGQARKWAYQKKFARTVPWNAFVYGTYELLVDAARRPPAETRVGQYFFEGWDQGHIGYADVVRQSDGSYSVASTGLAGSGVARVDSSGRLLSYSGEGTTYKQEVRRLDNPPDVDAIAKRFAADEQRVGVPSELSPRDVVHGRAGAAELTVDYGQPSRRGRALVGALIPYNEVWRTGANAATQFATTAPIELAGQPLQPGKYTLWTLPTPKGVQLIINRQTGQWGTSYDPRYDLSRRPMTTDSLPQNVERFTIRFDTSASARGRSGSMTSAGATALVMEWGTFRWSAPIQVIK